MTKDQIRHRIAQSVERSIAVKQQLIGSPEVFANIVAASELLTAAVLKGRKPVFFGNGGSAADAQHIAAEFVGRFAFDRPALPALALNANSSAVTAIGNDYGFENVFARQIEAFGVEGDVAIGISTSGNSANVVKGLEAARQRGMGTIGFTGAGGGKMKSVADICICVPSDETPRIQESHILIGHILAELAEVARFA